MKDKLKTIAAITSVMLSGCATNMIHQERRYAVDSPVAEMTYISPSNNTLPNGEIPQSDRISIMKYGEHVFIPPLTVGVYCNENRTMCRYGVLKSIVNINIKSDNDGHITAEGSIIYSVGRKASLLLPSTRESKSVPSTFPLLGSFSKAIHVYEKIPGHGSMTTNIFGGAKLIITNPR